MSGCRTASDQTCCGMRNYLSFNNTITEKKGGYRYSTLEEKKTAFDKIFNRSFGGYATLTNAQYKDHKWGEVLESLGWKAAEPFTNINTSHTIYIMTYSPPGKKKAS